jgi:hypothetical protein
VVKAEAHHPSDPEAAMLLKDGSRAAYVIQTNLRKLTDRKEDNDRRGLPPDDPKGDDQRGDTSDGLTQQEKDAIEIQARKVAKRELENQAYSVESMPLGNKGFDLRATRNQKVLLVEVKGHRGASYIAQVTEAQVQECERCAEPGSHEVWQLWNVEHLGASDPHEVTITAVCRIPPEARRADRYRVDLRKCEAVHHTGASI